jgi:hypothetical protein
VGDDPADHAARTVVHTIGHSTRSWDDFVALLRRHGIRRLVDVRTFPGSRRHPHFGSDAMREALAREGIAYEHAPALGGRRRPLADSPNGAWRNEGFRGYADHMRSDTFAGAIARLEEEAREMPTAIMCSEAVPWRCHRTLISDALVARGDEVLHILDSKASPHTLTRFGRVVDGEVRYDQPEADEPQRELSDGAGGLCAHACACERRASARQHRRRSRHARCLQVNDAATARPLNRRVCSCCGLSRSCCSCSGSSERSPSTWAAG